MWVARIKKCPFLQSKNISQFHNPLLRALKQLDFKRRSGFCDIGNQSIPQSAGVVPSRCRTKFGRVCHRQDFAVRGRTTIPANSAWRQCSSIDSVKPRFKRLLNHRTIVNTTLDRLAGSHVCLRNVTCSAVPVVSVKRHPSPPASFAPRVVNSFSPDNSASPGYQGLSFSSPVRHTSKCAPGFD